MSSQRHLIKDKQIITNGSMTGTAVITSSEIDITQSNQVGIDVTWTGTPNGTFTVEVATHCNLDGSGANFQAVTLSSSPTAAGSAGTNQIALVDLPFSRLRVKYTNTSSTGTLNAWANVKGF